MKRWAVVILAGIVLAGCGAENAAGAGDASLPPELAAQATRIAGDAQAQLASAQQNYQRTQAELYATATSVARADATKTAVQATLDTSAIKEAQARADTAALGVKLAQDQVEIQHMRNLSETYEITTSMILRGQDVARQQRSGDTLYQMIDWFMYAVPRGLILIALPAIIVFIIARFLHRVGEAVAAYAEDKIYPAQKALPPPPPQGDSDPKDVYSNTAHGRVLGSSPNTPNTPTKVVSRRGTSYLPSFSDEEYDQLEELRRDTIRLLEMVRVWLRKGNYQDTGMIPRYEELKKYNDHCDQEWRGHICRSLADSGFVRVKQGGRSDEQGTFILPPYNTVLSLLLAIEKRKIIVYPEGFESEALVEAERMNTEEREREMRQAQAIHALPMGVTAP